MISESMRELVNTNSTIRAMFEEGKKLAKVYGHENVFDYSIGNPNIEPPEEIKEIIKNIINDENSNFIHGYMNNSGYEDVRESIADYLNTKNNLVLDYNNIIMTCGAAGGLNVIFKSIINPGDEVIVIAPYFGEYRNYVMNFQGNIKEVSSDLTTFQPNINELRDAITCNTKAIIINSPNNPSGVIYSENILMEISKILEEAQKKYNREIYLVSDEPYREIVYDGKKVPCILKYYKNSFIGYSYSKSLSLPGERIGYIAVNPEMKDIEIILSALNIANRILGFVNAPSLFQRVIKKSLYLNIDSEIYKRNRDVLYNHLTNIGFQCIKPEGAFYLFPKCPIEDDIEFCNEAKKFNILAVPGSVFGCPGYFRLSYCIEREKIEKSLSSFEKLMNVYKR